MHHDAPHRFGRLCDAERCPASPSAQTTTRSGRLGSAGPFTLASVRASLPHRRQASHACGNAAQGLAAPGRVGHCCIVAPAQVALRYRAQQHLDEDNEQADQRTSGECHHQLALMARQAQARHCAAESGVQSHDCTLRRRRCRVCAQAHPPARAGWRCTTATVAPTGRATPHRRCAVRPLQDRKPSGPSLCRARQFRLASSGTRNEIPSDDIPDGGRRAGAGDHRLQQRQRHGRREQRHGHFPRADQSEQPLTGEMVLERPPCHPPTRIIR
jgi:hypothetical protein